MGWLALASWVVAINASMVVEMQYLGSGTCIGAPDVIYGFKVADTTAIAPADGEKWPLMYLVNSQEVRLGFCGSLSIGLTGGCCINSLDLDASQNYKSAAAQPYDSSILSSISQDANGKSYCQLVSMAGSSIHGYSQLMLLNSNQCIEGFVCRDGFLDSFGSLDCLGGATTYAINDSPQPISINGSRVTAKYSRISGAALAFQWVASVPIELEVPKFSSAMDITMLIAVAFANILALLTLIFALLRYLHVRSRWNMALLLSSIFWVICIEMQTIFLYYMFPTPVFYKYYLQTMYIAQNLATLSSVLCSNLFIFSILNWNRWVSIFVYTMIALLHICLCGGLYFEFYDAFGNTTWITIWLSLHFYWVLLMLFVCLIPPIFVALRLISQPTDTKWDCFMRLHKIDPAIFLLVSLQFATAVIYLFMRYIIDQTSWMYSDANSLNMLGILAMLLVVTASINIRITTTLRLVLASRLVIGTNSKKSPKLLIIASKKESKVAKTILLHKLNDISRTVLLKPLGSDRSEEI